MTYTARCREPSGGAAGPRPMRRSPRSLAAVILLTSIVSGACADDASVLGPLEGPWTPAPGIATRADLTCGTDGTATLSTDTVQPRPDGVHIRVINESDEPVSVAGFDADTGTTNWVSAYGPGTTELGCWPFSQHASGDAPERLSLEIVDPFGLYVDGSISCQIEMNITVDRSDGPTDEGPPSLAVARGLIDGLRQDDVLRVSGYPEQEGGAVIVIRDGETVARYGIQRFGDRPWEIAAGSACENTGLPHEGESYG